jgi:hypothetical protein
MACSLCKTKERSVVGEPLAVAGVGLSESTFVGKTSSVQVLRLRSRCSLDSG